MPALVSDAVVHNDIAKTGTMRELAELNRALIVLRAEFSDRFKVDIPDCTMRLLTEAELDEDFKRTRDPMRRHQIVAFASGTEIAFNPYSSLIERMKFLAHELGHCTLYSSGFEPEEYRSNGVMGPKRVYHEGVAEYFGRQGEEILRDHGFLGGRLANFFSRFNLAERIDRLIEESVIAKLLKETSVTVKDVLSRPDAVLEAHSEYFRPRKY